MEVNVAENRWTIIEYEREKNIGIISRGIDIDRKILEIKKDRWASTFQEIDNIKMVGKIGLDKKIGIGKYRCNIKPKRDRND